MNIIEELEKRGFIAALTEEEIRDWLGENTGTIYAGFDPTADSLHLGHLVPIMAMAHFQKYGHKALAVVGGATAMVGDPSGKSEERNLLTLEQVAENAKCVRKQMEKFLEFEGDNAALMLDNNDWIGPMSFTDWLRDVGKFFSVNYMVSKESVKQRLASETGISFTEFSYMTMQAYDFLYLFRNHGCNIQCGGNDQWGNITAGLDLIHKVCGREKKIYGITFPLMQTSTGEKFGKTAGNAVWLDPERTSPYEFYQYWIKTTDEDVEKFLKLFTFLPVDEIEAKCAEHMKAPERREAQKLLASEVTKTVHGEDGLSRARSASEALFGGELTGLDKSDLLSIFNDVPSSEIKISEIDGETLLIDLLASNNIVSSKGDAKRTIKQGGLYMNNVRVPEVGQKVSKENLLADSILIIRIGKKKYHLLQCV